MTEEIKSAEEVLDFWFGQLDEEGRARPEVSQRWFQKSDAFDEEIRRRFEGLYEEIAAGEHREWLQSPRGRLAYVIVLDQFSRNMFRDTPKMYALDDTALEVALEGIEADEEQQLAFAERPFLYMPLMHSESLEMQERCVELFEQFRDELQGEKRERIEYNLTYAVDHLKIVERFGRFPHRNQILGRPSSEEEIEFLKQPGSSF